MRDDSELLLAIAALQQGRMSAEAFTELLAQYEAGGDSVRRLLEQQGITLHPSLSSITQASARVPAGLGSISPASFPLSGSAQALAPLHPRVEQDVEDEHEGSTVPGLLEPAFGLLQELDLAQTVSEVPGRYENIQEYARGGMGRILHVRDLFLNRDIALKELLPGPTVRGMGRRGRDVSDRGARSLFLQEARTTGRLQHPSIVPVHEIGQRPDGTLYYTMKLVKGRPFSTAIRQAEDLAERLALLPHFLDVCHAIAYAHSQGVIHRDIKPRNIMIGEFAETVVIDWGLAIDLHDRASRLECEARGLSSRSTESPYADAMGTPAYMAPEQALGDHENVDERSDVYALGAVLYKLLTGKTPFKAESPDAVLHAVVHDAPSPVEEMEPRVPPELAAVCERAMSKDPAKRLPSALVLANEIERFQAGALLYSYEYNLRDRLLRWLRRNQSLVASGAAAIVALFLLTVYSYIQIVQQRNEAEIARLDAESATEHARMSLAEARRAQTESDASRAAAESASRSAKQSLYSAYISLAQNYMGQGSFERASSLLASCAPEDRNWEWGYLQFLCNQDYHTFPIPAAGVRMEAKFAPAAAFNASSRDLLIQGADGDIQVMDLHTGDLRRVLAGDAENKYIEPFYSDNWRYLGMIDDVACHVYDPHRFEILYTFPLLPHWQWRAQFSGDGTTLAVRDRLDAVALYDLENGQRISTLEVTPTVNLVTLNEDGSRVAAFTAAGGDGDGGILRIFRVADAAELAKWEAVQVIDMAFAKHGETLLVSSRSAIRVYEGPRYGDAEVLDTASGSRAMTWNSEATALAVGLDNGEVLIYDWPQRTLRQRIAAHRGAVTALCFDPAGTLLASGGEDHGVSLWASDNGALRQRFEGHSQPPERLVFHQTEPILFSASLQNVKLWSLARKDHTRFSAGQDVVAGAVSGDGRFFFAADALGRVIQHGLQDQTQQTVSEPLDAGASEVLLNAGASRVLLNGRGGLTLWSVPEGQRLLSIAAQGSAGAVAAFSPDGQMLALLYGAKVVEQPVIEIYDAVSGTLKKSVRPFLTDDLQQYFQAALAFSPDNRYLAAAVDKQAALFDLQEAGVGITLPLPQRSPEVKKTLAFSPDATTLAVGGGTAVTLLDRSGHRPPRLLEGHNLPVTAFCFSADGHRLISGGADGKVKVWNLDSGQELVNWQAFEQEVQFLLFAGNSELVAGDGRATVRIAPAFPWKEDELAGDRLTPMQQRLEGLKTLDPRLNTDWGRCQAKMMPFFSPSPEMAATLRTDPEGIAAWTCDMGGSLHFADTAGLPECSVHGRLWNLQVKQALIAYLDEAGRSDEPGAVQLPAQWLAAALPNEVIADTLQRWIREGRTGAAFAVCNSLSPQRASQIEGFSRLAGDAAYAVGDMDGAIQHYRRLTDSQQVHVHQLHRALARRGRPADLQAAYQLLTKRLSTHLLKEQEMQTLQLLNVQHDPVEEPVREQLRQYVDVDPQAWMRLPWHSDLAPARAASAESGKPIFLEISTQSAHSSQWLRQKIYSHPAVWRVLNSQFVLCRLDAETDPALVQRYRIQYFPSLLILDEDGDVLHQRIAFNTVRAILALVPPDVPAGSVFSWRITGPHPRLHADENESQVPAQASELIAALDQGDGADGWYSFKPNCYRPRARFVDLADPLVDGVFYALTRFELAKEGIVTIQSEFSHTYACWIDGELLHSTAAEDVAKHAFGKSRVLAAGPHEVLVRLKGTARDVFCQLQIQPEVEGSLSWSALPARPIIKSLAEEILRKPAIPDTTENITRVRVRKNDILVDWRANYLQYLATLNPRPYPDTGPIRGVQADDLSQVPLLASLGFLDGDVIVAVNDISVSDVRNWEEVSKRLQGQRSYKIAILRGGQPHVVQIDVEY